MQCRARAPRGLVDSVPVAVATISLGVTFGVSAAPLLGVWPAVIMSAVVWGGGAQFAALSVMTAGGSLLVASGAAVITNGRFVPMGFAIAPSLSGGLLSRVATGALLADASYVIARKDVGAVDESALRWAAPLQWLAWVGGTLVGGLGAALVPDPSLLGLDVIIPVFFLGLLLPDLIESPPARRVVDALRRTRIRPRPAVAALAAGVVTLVLTPLTPAGVPILAGVLTAVIGLKPPRAEKCL